MKRNKIKYVLWPAIDVRTAPIIAEHLTLMEADVKEDIAKLMKAVEYTDDEIKGILDKVNISVDFFLD